MIRISNEELNLGLDLSQRVYACSNSYNCLWSKRVNLFAGSLPRGCAKENCPVVIFRKNLEEDSPSYYAEALKLSQWDCVSLAATIDKKREVERRILEKRIYDLGLYGQLLTLIIQPLDLATKGTPFLKLREIETLRGNWRLGERQKTIQKIREINWIWSDWISSRMEQIVFNQTYRNSVFYLAYLFLKGVDQQLPDFEAMPNAEKESFFSEIEQRISV